MAATWECAEAAVALGISLETARERLLRAKTWCWSIWDAAAGALGAKPPGKMKGRSSRPALTFILLLVEIPGANRRSLFRRSNSASRSSHVVMASTSSAFLTSNGSTSKIPSRESRTIASRTVLTLARGDPSADKKDHSLRSWRCRWLASPGRPSTMARRAREMLGIAREKVV